jgi:hypothetical protein
VSRHRRTLEKVLLGTSDANISFDDLRNLLVHLGFSEKSRGSHHIFRKTGVDEMPNLQRDGVQAKPYQVRGIILRHGLGDAR